MTSVRARLGLVLLLLGLGLVLVSALILVYVSRSILHEGPEPAEAPAARPDPDGAAAPTPPASAPAPDAHPMRHDRTLTEHFRDLAFHDQQDCRWLSAPGAVYMDYGYDGQGHPWAECRAEPQNPAMCACTVQIWLQGPPRPDLAGQEVAGDIVCCDGAWTLTDEAHHIARSWLAPVLGGP